MVEISDPRLELAVRDLTGRPNLCLSILGRIGSNSALMEIKETWCGFMPRN